MKTRSYQEEFRFCISQTDSGYNSYINCLEFVCSKRHLLKSKNPKQKIKREINTIKFIYTTYSLLKFNFNQHNYNDEFARIVFQQKLKYLCIKVVCYQKTTNGNFLCICLKNLFLSLASSDDTIFLVFFRYNIFAKLLYEMKIIAQI